MNNLQQARNISEQRSPGSHFGATAPARSRFDDNTKTVVADRLRRYGYAPGVLMSMSPQGSNLPGEYIPQGVPLLFLPRVDNYVNSKSMSWDTLESSSERFVKAVERSYRYGEGDTGFRYLDMLTDLPYDKSGYDEADAYLQTLLPRITCEMGLETGPTDPCPTCRLKWLESAECSDAIQNAAVEGLNPDVLMSLRTELIGSNQACITFLKTKHSDIKKEVEAKRQGWCDEDFQIMKRIHEKSAETKQAEFIADQAKLQGQAMAESLKEVLADRDKDAELAELRAKVAAFEAQNAKKGK